MAYYPTNIYNTTTRTMVDNRSIWQQIADFLRAIGQTFVAMGRVLVMIGEVIYEVFFR